MSRSHNLEYRQRTPRSAAQFARAREVLPGGVAKGAYFHAPYPLYLERSEGCSVYDLDGRRYLDFRNHHTALVLGHNHPAVVAAIEAQLRRGVALGGPVAAEEELARELCRRVPSVERVRFTCSGTEASVHAVRLARGWTGRTRIAKFEGGYHGSHDAVEISVRPPLDQAGQADAPRPVAGVRGLSPGALDEVLVLPYGDAGAVERLLCARRDELAAVLCDPKAGIYEIEPEFFRWLRRLTADLGLLLILDEVVSFRVAPGGLQELYGIAPDLTVFGKIVGGGLPAGAFGGRADLMDLLDTGRSDGYFQSGTFSGHPLAMAAGWATLQQLTPAAYARLDALGWQVRDGISDLFRRLGMPALTVGLGSLFSVYFTDQPVTDYRSAATADGTLAQRVFLGLLAKGIMLSPGLTMNAVSLPMEASHVDELVAGFDAVLRIAAG